MFIFKFKTKIRRKIVKILGLNRPTSFPFVTGDGFRALAQHVFDEISDIEPKNVEENDIVFVRSDFLDPFFKEKHPYIRNKYILISHNMDTNIGPDYKKYIDNKIIHWFAQNLAFKNDKTTPIPIGVINYHYSSINNNGRVSTMKRSSDLSDRIFKKNKISFGFTTTSNIERVNLKNSLETNDLLIKIENKDQFKYFTSLSEYKFIVSPEGNGTDCHRTWESLYLGTIPIVKKSISMAHFKDLGIPLFIVENWDELKSLNADLLSEKYTEIMNNLDSKALYMNYWINIIISKKI
jgi:hypothetical protein